MQDAGLKSLNDGKYLKNAVAGWPGQDGKFSWNVNESFTGWVIAVARSRLFIHLPQEQPQNYRSRRIGQ